MYVDILSQNAFVSYNVKMANLVGLNAAVYLAVISNVAYDEVTGGTNNTGIFELDRNWIEAKTALTVEEQYVCDNILSRLGIIEVLDDDRVKVGIHFDVVASILTESDLKVLDELRKKAKVKRGEEKHSKNYYIIKRIKTKVEEKSLPEVVKTAINTWLDALAEKNQAISSQAVDIWINTIDSYTNNDSVKVKIYEQAAMLGMYNVNNAIQKYELTKKSPANGNFIGAEQKIGTTVNKQRKF